MKGIDVSYHNGIIDWNKVKKSEMVDFVIIRAGYGKSTMDKQFLNNIVGAETTGIKVGIYWFIYAKNEEESLLNAKKCEEYIKPYKDIISMRVWADWEYDSDKKNPQTKESRTNIVKAFCDYLFGKGYEVGVYANPDYLNGKFGDLSEYPLWLARYSSDKGNYEPYMWQYSSSGSVDGINTKVDMNEYYGKIPQKKNESVKKETVKYGDMGENVFYLQQRLTAKGYGVGAIDRKFGNKTLEAVKAFQAENNLTVDGIVGINTWNALENSGGVIVKEYSLARDGEMQISKNFKVKEFRCKDGSDKILIDTDFVMNKLQKIRDHFSAPITINSAYRTELYNKKVGGAKSSYHMKGQAFDIVVKGHTTLELARFAQSIGVTGIIQYNTFVHIDSRPTRYWARNDNGKVIAKSTFI